MLLYYPNTNEIKFVFTTTLLLLYFTVDATFILYLLYTAKLNKQTFKSYSSRVKVVESPFSFLNVRISSLKLIGLISKLSTSLVT